MNYGMFLSAQGAQAQSLRLDTVANNVANASTTAFKRDLAIFQAQNTYDDSLGLPDEHASHLNQHSGGVTIQAVQTDFSTGPLSDTGGTFDLALTGPGFFQVSQNGQNFLSRDGAFAMNDQNELVTTEGMHVLSESGERITLGNNLKNVSIAGDGTITEQRADGSSSQNARIAVVQPESVHDLVKVGNNLYRTESTTTPAGPDVQIKQGMLEGSGVNSVSEMTQMIEASRAYETNINMMKYQDEALGRLLQAATR